MVEPGTFYLSFYLSNTVQSAFVPGIQGFYDAGVAVAVDAGAVKSALEDFAALDGVTISISPTDIAAEVGTGTGNGPGSSDGFFTMTYVFAEDSPAVGKEVAIGFHSEWTGPGAYIFGRERAANSVDLIPEASTAALLGLAGLGLLRRRR